MTFDAEAVYTELHGHFRERVRRNEPLARHCTFGVGGPADVWVSVDARDDLIRLVRLCAERQWPLLIVGNGTNVLFADARRAASSSEEFSVPLVRRYQHDELDLSYRHSRFRVLRRVQFDERGYPMVAPRGLIEPSEIIMQLGIRLHRENPQKLRKLIEQYKQHRKTTQPPQQSAGSVFKNPSGDFAGRLIEQAGLKGMIRGKAQISERHANFIVNLGGASAADVATLIKEARNAVREKFGVDLELEVELRGEWEML